MKIAIFFSIPLVMTLTQATRTQHKPLHSEARRDLDLLSLTEDLTEDLLPLPLPLPYEDPRPHYEFHSVPPAAPAAPPSSSSPNHPKANAQPAPEVIHTYPKEYPSAAPARPYPYSYPPPYQHKRDFLSCAETYGGGSTTCGNEQSHFCFDPSVGEECCSLDNGYCEAGDFCAPVSGFCCHDGEDPTSCASRLHFTIPNNPKVNAITTTATTPPNMTVSVTVSTNTWLSTAHAAGDVSTTITVSMPTSVVKDIQIDTSVSTSSLLPDRKKPAGLTTTISTTTSISAEAGAGATGTSMALGEEASVTGAGMKPELTAPAAGKQPGSDSAPFTGTATSKQVVGWSIILLVIGVVVCGLGA